jgi:hypothetical protein
MVGAPPAAAAKSGFALGLSIDVDLCNPGLQLQAAWRCLSDKASWHRGGADDDGPCGMVILPIVAVRPMGYNFVVATLRCYGGDHAAS